MLCALQADPSAPGNPLFAMLPAMVPALQGELEAKIAGRSEEEVDDFLLMVAQFALNARSWNARSETHLIIEPPGGPHG